MTRVRTVPFEHPDAVALRARHVAEGDALYASEPAAAHRGGSEGLDPASVLRTVVAYEDDVPVGHACVRRLDAATSPDRAGELEIKRMFVVTGSRGSGVADELLAAMEDAVREAGASHVVIHTGERQAAALRFYDRHGYTPIEVFHPYRDVTYSRCFEKSL